MRLRERLFEGLESLDPFAAGFARLVFGLHPEWREHASISSEWPTLRGGGLEIALPHPSGEPAEPFRLFAAEDECLIVYDPGHDHAFLSLFDGDEQRTFAYALEVTEDVLAEKRVVVSVFEAGRDRYSTQYEGAPEDVSGWLASETGKRYEVWSWLETYKRAGIVKE